MIFDKERKQYHRRKKFHALTKGVFSTKIPYENRLLGKKWKDFFGSYVGQRYGFWDTHNCWDWAGVVSCKTQSEFLWKTGQFSEEDKKWFLDNKFCDTEGNFYYSYRWGAILGGVYDNGNDQAEFWNIVEKVGLIPESMLSFTPSQYGSRQDFINDFFNESLITPEMKALGLEWLKRVKVQSQELGKRWSKREPDMIITALQLSPLQIGTPVPNDGSWNQEKVKWDGSYELDHSTMLYDFLKNDPYPYFDYDSYIPNEKRLSADYYIPLISQGVLTARNPAITLPEPTKQSPLSILISYALAIFYGMGFGAKDPQIASG